MEAIQCSSLVVINLTDELKEVDDLMMNAVKRNGAALTSFPGELRKILKKLFCKQVNNVISFYKMHQKFLKRLKKFCFEAIDPDVLLLEMLQKDFRTVKVHHLNG